MRSLWFIPFTFVAGQHGFVFFAPYLAFCLGGLHLVHVWQRRAPRAPLIVAGR